MNKLGETDRDNVVRCVRAVVEGPFIPDWEFSTVMGFTREEMADRFAGDLRNDDGRNVDMALAALNNLSGYPHGMSGELFKMTGLDMRDVAALRERFRHVSRSESSEH